MRFLRSNKFIVPLSASALAVCGVSTIHGGDMETVQERAWDQLGLDQTQRIPPTLLFGLIKSAGYEVCLDPNGDPVQEVIKALHPFADRKGKELYNMEHKAWLDNIPSADQQTFLQKISISEALPKIKKDERYSTVLFGGFASRRDTRQMIALEATKGLKLDQLNMVLTVTGSRPMDLKRELEFLKYPHALKANQQNESFIFSENKEDFARSLAVGLDQLHFIDSPIHPEIYKEKQERATTFDNAISLGQFLKNKMELGLMTENEHIILCLEEPFCLRMGMIIKDILSNYINNPITVYSGKTSAQQTSIVNAVNQAYMIPKAKQHYLENIEPRLKKYCQKANK